MTPAEFTVSRDPGKAAGLASWVKVSVQTPCGSFQMW